MSMNLQPERIERLPGRSSPDALDDRVVLRLSRTSLRAEPPVVEFVDRVASANGQQRALWPA
jgi:hypothetical protein